MENQMTINKIFIFQCFLTHLIITKITIWVNALLFLIFHPLTYPIISFIFIFFKKNMQDFLLWFSTGFEHIWDINAMDHILFITAFSITYSYKDSKKLIILATAFTIGHSLTLALSALHLFYISPLIIEIAIPITIVCTAALQLIRSFKHRSDVSLHYGLALFFGLIHGMGFSYLLRSMLGKEENIFLPLFAFNIGLEAAQIIIIALILLISLFSLSILKIKPFLFNRSILFSILLFSLIMTWDRVATCFNT